MMKFSYFIICIIFCTISLSDGKLIDPYFKLIDGLESEVSFTCESLECKVNVNEDLNENQPLLELLNDESIINITPLDPQENILKLTIKDNKLILGIKLDYEELNQHDYVFKIDNIIVQMFINNINNKEPYFTKLVTQFIIEENKIYVTDYYLTVKDPDGWLEEPTYELSDYNDVFGFDITPNEIYERDFHMKTKEMLDFETISLYSLNLTVSDGLFPISTAIIIKVKDMPDKDPIWQSIFAVEEVEEIAPFTFTVSARDGDLEINAKINYWINCDDDIDVKIDNDTGIIISEIGIDRDEPDKDLFRCIITAYELIDPKSKIVQDVSFRVIDINNKWPEITFKQNDNVVDYLNLTMYETSKAEIPSNTIINVNDRDTGENAYYTVQLETVNDDGPKYEKAFQIIPSNSYKSWDFALTILNNTLLDYEEPNWRSFELNVVSIENKDKTHTRMGVIKVNLINWNDERPQFERNQYTFHVKETVGLNEEIAKVLATDRDLDQLSYELSGSYIQRLLIVNSNEIDEGVVNTKISNAFDYETMPTVVFQVIARETNTVEQYTASTEVIINVIDVNDETPQITISNSLNAIEENQPDGQILEDIEIIVTDADQSANLQIEIVWTKSYFTKNGARVNNERIDQYFGCITLELSNVNGPKLQIKETVQNNTPNYELFDTMYIYIKATDLNQEVGKDYAEAIIPISIIDVNDNAPEFISSTITSTKKVTEKSKIDTAVGIVTAIDIDGEGNNNITYSLKPLSDDTPVNLIEINSKTGELRVVSEDIIADPPNGFTYLNYNVVATDGKFDTVEEIRIYVEDQNNQKPELVIVPSTIEINEKSSEGTKVILIEATDNDRDEPHNVLRYTLDAKSQSIFRINSGTGLITVGPDGPDLLDRDFGEQSHTISGIIYDNDGDSSNGIILNVPFTFQLNLIDINDQMPEIDQQNDTISFTQNTEEDVVLTTVKATDRDKTGTDNSKITLSVIEIKSDNNRDIPNDLFVIDNNANQSPAIFELKTGTNLKCCYGDFDVIIRATDHGKPQLTNNKDATYKIRIEPYNFVSPIIIYPEDDQQFLLSTDQKANLNLNCYVHNVDCITEFNGTDDQGDKFQVIFSIDIDTNPDDLFYFRQEKNKATLLLNNINFVPFKEYDLKIIATTQGEPVTSTTKSITLKFIDPNPYPSFDVNERKQTIAINECDGLGKIINLPNATYPFDYEIPGLEIYYALTNFNPKEYTTHFRIEEKANRLELIDVLDREAYETVTFDILASRSINRIVKNDESVMSVTVNIIDDNDNPPVFLDDSYSATIMVSYDIGKFLIEIRAEDIDVNDTLEWTEIKTVSHVDGITNVKDIFKIDSTNGSVYLNFKVQNSMRGYYDYHVQVSDTVHAIETIVKIYIVSDDNRLNIQFENNINFVEDNKDEITDIFTKNTAYECQIESIQRGIDDNGNQVDTYTTVLMYFLDQKTSEPIDKHTMEAKLRMLSIYQNLLSDLDVLKLNLKSLGEEKEVNDNIEDVLKAWLIGVSVSLGTVCIILIITFIIKVRSLSTRLNKLTVTKFGSQESGLNRIQAAPGTNMRATEGANPIFNISNITETRDNDRESLQSYESGLIGVENNDDFNMDNFKSRRESVNPTVFATDELY